MVHLLGVVIVILTIKYVHLDRLVGGRIGLTRVVTRVSNRDPVDGESGDELSARGVGESLQGTSEAVVMGRRRARSEELRKRKEKRRNDKGHSLHWQDRAAEEEITDGNRITHSLYFVFDDDLALINIVLGMCAPYVDKSGYHIDLLLLVHTRKRDVLPLFFRMR